MSGFNPIEWIAWLYGKFFQNHPYLGGALVAVICASLGLILWSRGIDKFREENAPKGEATTFSKPSQQVVAQVGKEASGISKMGPESVEPKSQEGSGPKGSDHSNRTTPKTKKMKPSAAAPIGSVRQSNSGRINVQQATTGANSPIITSPITISDEPPLPDVRWTTEKLAAGDGKNPGVMIHISIDRRFPNAAFAALCDRPCTSVVAVVPTAGFTDSAGAFSKANPRLVAVKLDLPPLVASSDNVNWEVRSNDGGEVTVLRVEAIRQQ
jgi:hypothetical protein